MNKYICPEDVIKVARSFLSINEGDESTEDVILAVAAELLDVSTDRVREMIYSAENS